MRPLLISALAAIAAQASQVRAEPAAGPPLERTFYLFGPSLGAMPASNLNPRSARTPASVAAPAADICRRAARAAGQAAGVPDNLLSAIARIETGRPDDFGGTSPWPWSINVQGIDHVYDSKEAVIAAVMGFQSRGIRSIDVGCLQVNLMYHPTAFANLEQAFDPLANATYAASFLAELRDQTGTWERAVAYYHSANPELGEPYRRKVMAALPEEQRMAAAPVALAVPRGAGAVGAMLFNPVAPARILPLAANAAPGRDIGAYRATPVQITRRSLPVFATGSFGAPPRMPPA